jgi:hypothetical protein
MLDGVSQVDGFRRPADFRQGRPQQLAGRSNERPTFAVFDVPGLLANQNH